jgi:diadenosine tetraphosphate (Ap4A) HIT family hydrolase
MTNCPFCNQNESRVILSNPHALAIPDTFPLAPGHTLIIPKRHIASLFEATREEQTAMLDLLTAMRERLLTPLGPTIAKEGRASVPDGFNIGINDGAAAGQTVMHLHIHLIPRYAGDMPDPRGGVRWVFPDKAAYWDK